IFGFVFIESVSNPLIIPYPNASDICDANLTIFNDAPNTYQLGLKRVTYNIIDDTGNTTIITHDVTVIDTTKPVFLEVSANKTLPTLTYVPDESYDPLDTNSCFIPNIPIPKTYDNGYSVSELTIKKRNLPNCYNPPAPSDPTDSNIYTITWDVIDPSGNKETVTQDIRVKRQYIIISTGFENNLGAFIPD
ncbi:MAG: hypothetical protein AAB319_02090, partial [Pseudomonadota bacterium]